MSTTDTIKEAGNTIVDQRTESALLRRRVRYYEQEDARKAKRIDELQKEVDELKRKP